MNFIFIIDTALECIPIKDIFIPPLPKESLDNPPPPPPPNESDDSDEPSQDTQSPASEVKKKII